MNNEKLLMTCKEYKELYDEFQTTDSLKRKDEIHNLFYEQFLALFHVMRVMYAKYKQFSSLVVDSDWRSDSGYYYIREDDINREHVELTYSDSWAYGGECCFGIVLYAKWLDPDVRNNTEETLKQTYIKRLKDKLDSYDREIVRIQTEQAKIRVTLTDLGVDPYKGKE